MTNNKIVGYTLEPPENLLANPLNPRRHPNTQREALRSSLDELGWIAPIIVNQTTGYVIDGHARCEQAITDGIKEIPVLYVELSKEEEHKALAVYDAISAMATYDEDIVTDLLENIEFEHENLAELLEDKKPKGEKKPKVCPACGHQF